MEKEMKDTENENEPNSIDLLEGVNKIEDEEEKQNELPDSKSIENIVSDQVEPVVSQKHVKIPNDDDLIKNNSDSRQKLLDRSLYRTDQVLKSESKTCINCGALLNFKKHPKRSDYCKFNHNQKVPSLSSSKCSQLSEKHSKHSLRSIGPCQSFDQCSICNKVIFAANPSCASFDVCEKCKKSKKNSTQRVCCSQSRDFKARSVNFSTLYENVQDESIIQASDCISNISQKQKFCGCNSTLKCNKPCVKEPQDCSGATKSFSNINFCPPKEPSQLTMMRNMLQERIAACNTIQPEKKKSKVRKQIDSTKPRRHRMKRTNQELNTLECPSNPCCISDERKERLENVTSKLIQREEIRQKEIQKKREERLKRLQKDQCKTGEKCCEKEPNDKCKEYCKKYKKMNYEIEIQNYLVDKLNRDLKMKISKNYPVTIVRELSSNLEKEINKLKEMIDFTIFEQCQNKDLKWGSIPVSPLTSNTTSNPTLSCCLPKTPSCVSNVSAFSMLNELKLSQEKERHKQQTEIQNNRQKHIADINKEIQILECKMNQIKCVHEQFLEGLELHHKKESSIEKNFEKNQSLENVKSQIENIKVVINKTKEEIEQIHTKMHLFLNEV